ncbi:MAG: hypothetical protein ACI9GM_001321, partial [Salibacteraceae bacterium]
SSEVNWKLSDTERKELLLDWTMKSVVSSDFIAEQFIHEKGWETK